MSSGERWPLVPTTGALAVGTVVQATSGGGCACRAGGQAAGGEAVHAAVTTAAATTPASRRRLLPGFICPADPGPHHPKTPGHCARITHLTGHAQLCTATQVPMTVKPAPGRTADATLPNFQLAVAEYPPWSTRPPARGQPQLQQGGTCQVPLEVLEFRFGYFLRHPTRVEAG